MLTRPQMFQEINATSLLREGMQGVYLCEEDEVQEVYKVCSCAQGISKGDQIMQEIEWKYGGAV